MVALVGTQPSPSKKAKIVQLFRAFAGLRVSEVIWLAIMTSVPLAVALTQGWYEGLESLFWMCIGFGVGAMLRVFAR